jgi:hypothetical protein
MADASIEVSQRNSLMNHGEHSPVAS